MPRKNYNACMSSTCKVMATNSSSLPLRTSEDANVALNSSVSPASTVDGDNQLEVPLLSDLQLSDRICIEGDTQLRVGSGSSKLEDRVTTIDSLPDELMLEIFSYVSFGENINVLQKVSTRWRSLAQDAHLWLHRKYVIRYETSEEDIIATFAAAPQLRTVIILDTEVSPRVLEALSRSCPHLTTLEMHYRQMLTYSEADNLFNGCREIRTLTISDRGLRADARFPDAVARLADLRELRVRESEYADGYFVLHILADGCPHLSVLELGNTFGLCYWIRDAEYFISSHKCVLESLRIRWTSVEGRMLSSKKFMRNGNQQVSFHLGQWNDGRSIVPLLSRVQTLRRLDLIDGREGGPEGAAEALTALGRLCSLRQLHFGVRDGNVRHLVPSVFQNGGLAKLQHLHLNYMVVDEVTRAVAEHCPELRELALWKCEGHTGALFQPLCRLEKLESLKISYCGCLGGKAMSYIAKLPALHVLEFSDIKFYKLKPNLKCFLEMSELRRLYLRECICWGIPFAKFPGRLVNLRELEIDYCDGDQAVLDRMSAQMPGLRVEGYLGALITDDSYDGDCDDLQNDYDS